MTTASLNFFPHAKLAALGIFCILLGFLNPLLSAAFLANLVLFLISIRYPMLTWKFLLYSSLVFCFMIPYALNFLLTWELLVTLAGGIGFAIIRKKEAFHWPPYRLALALTLFCFLALLCLAFSSDLTQSIKEVSRYLLSFIIFVLYLNWITEQQTSQGIQHWIYTALFAGPLLLVLFLGRNAGIAPPEIGDLSGQITTLGWTLSMLLTICVSLLIGRWSQFGVRHILFFAFLAVSLYLSVSRAAYLAAMLGTGIIIWDILPKRSRKFLLLAGLLFAVAGFIFFCFADKETLFKTIVRNLSGRNFLWKAAVKTAVENPWTGIGPGCWHLMLSNTYLSVDFLLADRHGNSFILSPDLLGGEAHNLFLTKLAEMGFFSPFLIAAIFATWAAAAYSALKQIRSSAYYELSRGCFAAVVSMMLYGLLENGPIVGRGRGAEVFLLWFVAAIPLVASRWPATDRSTNLFLPPFLQICTAKNSYEVSHEKSSQ